MDAEDSLPKQLGHFTFLHLHKAHSPCRQEAMFKIQVFFQLTQQYPSKLYLIYRTHFLLDFTLVWVTKLLVVLCLKFGICGMAYCNFKLSAFNHFISFMMIKFHQWTMTATPSQMIANYQNLNPNETRHDMIWVEIWYEWVTGDDLICDMWYESSHERYLNASDLNQDLICSAIFFEIMICFDLLWWYDMIWLIGWYAAVDTD